jgi:hypothetical protein
MASLNLIAGKPPTGALDGFDTPRERGALRRIAGLFYTVDYVMDEYPCSEYGGDIPPMGMESPVRSVPSNLLSWPITLFSLGT